MKGLQSTLESDYGVAIGDSAKVGGARTARATLSGARHCWLEEEGQYQNSL